MEIVESTQVLDLVKNENTTGSAVPNESPSIPTFNQTPIQRKTWNT